MSNSRMLRTKIELFLPDAAAAARELQEHPEVATIFPRYMVAVHSMIRASVPLMRTALERCRELDDGRVADKLIPYFAQHVKEETDHDEWLLQDLAALGFDRDEILSRVPSPTIASMVGSQYYWILHHHPLALLGYIAVMEGYPPTVAQIDALAERTGFPRVAFRTMLKHVHLDIHHRDDLDALLDDLPLRPSDHALLGMSAMHTMDLGVRAVREVLEKPPHRRA